MYQSAQNYYQDIPANTSQQMFYAAGGAFVLHTVLTGNLYRGAVGAALSALATAIHGLVTPLFISVTGKTQLKWHEEMCRTFFAIIGVAAIAKACGDNAILSNLPFFALLYGFCNYADQSRRDLRSTSWILIATRYVPVN